MSAEKDIHQQRREWADEASQKFRFQSAAATICGVGALVILFGYMAANNAQIEADLDRGIGYAAGEHWVAIAASLLVAGLGSWFYTQAAENERFADSLRGYLYRVGPGGVDFRRESSEEAPIAGTLAEGTVVVVEEITRPLCQAITPEGKKVFVEYRRLHPTR